MNLINSYTLQIGDTDKEISVRDNALFVGCELKHHEILVWVVEPDKGDTHTVYLKNIIEYGSFDDNEVYIGCCDNRFMADDETFHVVGSSPTLAIRSLAVDNNLVGFISSLTERINGLEKEVGRLERTKAGKPGRRKEGE